MSKKKATATCLPISRTSKIMTSAVGVESVNQDIVAMATKATEIFLTDFARRAYELSDSNAVDYDDITNLVHSDPRYDFLVDTTPKRMKLSEAMKLIEEAKRHEAELEAEIKAASKPPSSPLPPPAQPSEVDLKTSETKPHSDPPDQQHEHDKPSELSEEQ